jgi:hypothetical protein
MASIHGHSVLDTGFTGRYVPILYTKVVSTSISNLRRLAGIVLFPDFPEFGGLSDDTLFLPLLFLGTAADSLAENRTRRYPSPTLRNLPPKAERSIY